MHMCQAYEHHCIERLPARARRLRDAAVYMVANSLVLQWALEIYGFRDVSIKARAPASCCSCHHPLLHAGI